ncbi:hypothetical protein M405DRAFT_813957 [Rhizopogon salebrosus TDB-379]|nr:hypothetical protein M405DRAFT_813957 [Rhizopogon salebrosus TDB-379]
MKSLRSTFVHPTHRLTSLHPHTTILVSSQNVITLSNAHHCPCSSQAARRTRLTRLKGVMRAAPSIANDEGMEKEVVQAGIISELRIVGCDGRLGCGVSVKLNSGERCTSL